MSFSAQVKQELCSQPLERACCALAEAYGMLLYCNTFTPKEVRIVTESPQLKQRLPRLFRAAFGLDFDALPARAAGKGSFLITREEKLKAIFAAFGYEVGTAVALHVNFGVLEEQHCRLAFLRGAFLAGGSVTAPEKGYHLELATSHYNVSRETPALMQEAGFSAKTATRSSNYVLYFKQSGPIERFLSDIGAPDAAAGFQTAREERTLRGSVNRQMNCDAANLDKLVAAAQEQIEAIRRLEERGGLDELPDKLREAARLRVENPELTLAQLAELCSPAVTKSCFNHRLRKLIALAGKDTK